MVFLLCILIAFTACTPRQQTNQIKSQRSAYLKQSHSDSIWWQPWGLAALEVAKENDKLIYLDIGYATCSACERMQSQVYNDTQVGEKLNQSFVSIKIDREERPDLDAYFLNMQTAIMKFGAWPIHLVLTPDLQPVYATTFMQKSNFLKLLNQLDDAWKNQKEKIQTESSAFLKRIEPVKNQNQTQFDRDESLIKDFYARYTHRFDSIYGGLRIGQNYTPKFPVNDDMRLLLRYHFQTKEKQALQMVKKTMSTQLKSALFDQIDGGFHRYSLARNWNVPNFEKTLQDQAGFISALVELNQVAPNTLYTDKIEATVAFLLNSFKSPLGGFYSSQGATLTSQEGRYHTWQRHEIQTVLNKKQMTAFDESFSLTPQVAKYSQRSALFAKTGFDSKRRQEVISVLKKSAYKSKAPEFDNKVVTATNAYLLSALIRLAHVWPSQGFEKIINDNLDFLLLQHQNLNGQLYRRSIGGEVQHPGILDDYAFLIDALIEYYQLTFNEDYLFKANALQKIQDQLFFASDKKIYRYSLVDPNLGEAQFLFKDQDIPSGQSMSYWNLIRLARYFQNTEYQQQAEGILNSFPDQLRSDPLSYKHLLLALDFQVSQSKDFIISATKEICRKRAKELNQGYFPYKLLSCAFPNSRLPINHDKITTPAAPPTYQLCFKNSCQPSSPSFTETQAQLFRNEH